MGTTTFREVLIEFQDWRSHRPRELTTGFNTHDVTGLGLIIEMQLETTSLKLPQNTLDTPLDGRMIGANASDEFLNDGPKRCWRKCAVWDAHRISGLRASNLQAG